MVVDETAEYLPMFLAEGREHLQELNLAVVRIEETPDDQATVDEIFRIAHSLKGMSATMGFAGMAALTHEMEDVFELLRQRKQSVLKALGVAIQHVEVLAFDIAELAHAQGLGEGERMRRAGLVGLRRNDPHVLADLIGDVLEHVEARRLDAVVIGDQDTHALILRCLDLGEAAHVRQ